MLGRFNFFILVAIITFVNVYKSEGAYLVYEDFQSYNLGDLNGQGSASGNWSGNWTANTGAFTLVTVGSELSYSFSGNSILVQGGNVALQVYGDGTNDESNKATRNFNTIDTTSGNVFYSFLFRYTNLSDGLGTNNYFEVGGDTGPRPLIRLGGGDANGDFVVEHDTNDPQVFGSTISINTTYFVVLKVEASGGKWKNVYGYLNPLSVTSESSEYSSSVSFLNSALNANITELFMSTVTINSGDIALFDEFRVGTSWSDVIPTETITTPNSSPTNIKFSNVTASSIDVAWTNGSGNNRLVLVSAGNLVDTDPTNATTYLGNTIFGGGAVIGNSYSVFNGSSGNSLTVTGLSGNTTYYFSIFEYNGYPGAENYRTSDELLGNQVTYPSTGEPSINATNGSAVSTSTTSINVSWTRGNGANVMVLARTGVDIATDPSDNSSYSGSSTLGGGSVIGSANVVYNGDGTSVTVSGLTRDTTYYFAVYEYNGLAGSEDYRTSDEIHFSGTTLAVPATILEYKFNETSGTTATDSSSSSKNLTYGTNVNLGQLGVQGNAVQLGGAITTAVSGNTIQRGSFGASYTDLTVSIFYKYNSLDGYLYSWGGSLADRETVSVNMVTGTGIALEFHDGDGAGGGDDGNQATLNPTGWDDGKWHHLVVVKSTATLSAYFDGNVITLTDPNGIATGPIDTTANGNPFVVGGKEDYTDGADAYVDNLFVYNSALTASEVYSIIETRIAYSTLATDNSYIDIEFDKNVFNTSAGSGAVQASDFSLAFNQNGGTATGMTISSANNSSGNALSGGEDIVRLYLNLTGSASGVEQIDVTTVDNASIYNIIGAPAISGNATTGTKVLTVTPDTTPPVVQSFLPIDNATNVLLNQNLQVYFDETISKGSGNYVIYDAGDNIFQSLDVASSNVVVSGNLLTVSLSGNFLASTNYYIKISGGSVRDSSLNNWFGISDNTTWNFTTGTTADTTAPVVNVYSPTDGATNVSVSSNLLMSFDEDLQLGTGNVNLYTSVGGLVETMNVQGARISLSSNIVTIDPTSDLSYSQGYYILIDSGGFQDTTGNDYTGISVNTDWNFTTENAPAASDTDNSPKRGVMGFGIQSF